MPKGSVRLRSTSCWSINVGQERCLSTRSPMFRAYSLVCGSENYIGADGNPKSVVADKRDLNEHANNCESHKNKRKRKSEVHNASPWRCLRTSEQRFSNRAFM